MDVKPIKGTEDLESFRNVSCKHWARPAEAVARKLLEQVALLG